MDQNNTVTVEAWEEDKVDNKITFQIRQADWKIRLKFSLYIFKWYFRSN